MGLRSLWQGHGWNGTRETPAVPTQDLRTHIETQQADETSAHLKATIEAIGLQAHENAWRIDAVGQTIGQGTARLWTDGMGIAAPKDHPVWADDLRHESRTLRAMGEPIVGGVPWNTPTPWEQDTTTYPYAHRELDTTLMREDHAAREARLDAAHETTRAMLDRLKGLTQGPPAPAHDLEHGTREYPHGLER